MTTILYVEDELWRYQSVLKVLEVDYDIVTARDADQALTVLRAYMDDAQKPDIDLIVLDINMPDVDSIPDPNDGRTSGVQFARVVLKELGFDIPIICYTVYNNAMIYEELLEDIGVKEIVSKTKSTMELREIIQKYLSPANNA